MKGNEKRESRAGECERNHGHNFDDHAWSWSVCLKARGFLHCPCNLPW